MQTRHRDIPASVTRDGSIVRELMHSAVHGGNGAQRLAEATVPAGALLLRILCCTSPV
jgi:hypothetical protein